MEWKYVKTLKRYKNIDDFEMLVNYKFPDVFRECVVKYNGGRPDKRGFDTNKQKKRELKSFLSFNQEDRETVWKIFDWNKVNLFGKYVPFAIDNFGNLICFDVNDSHIIFWNHENNSVEYVAKSFNVFLEQLFE